MVQLATSRYQATDLICASGLVPVGITVGRPRCLDGIGIEVFQRRFAEISGAHDGRGLVFLCFEPVGEFCHRHVFADWLQQQSDRHVHELVAGLAMPNVGAGRP
jgi:hypothetical protein